MTLPSSASTRAPVTIALPSPFAYWWRVMRFALLGRRPTSPAEVPVWALCVPFRLWNTVCRADGRTFEVMYTPGASRFARAIMPLRFFYLLFLLAWPLVAFTRALAHGRRAPAYFRHALQRPELALFHPKADFSPKEIAWGRPDYALGMFYACAFAQRRSEFFMLDDKRRFIAACAQHGLPVPPTLSAAEAIREGGAFIVKDPIADLGYGVALMSAQEIAAEPDSASFVIQRRLCNHSTLRAIFSDAAPLSSLRVFTSHHPKSGAIEVTGCAVRIGRAGSVVDNTAQGGIWARVDLATGKLEPGVMKKTFGVLKNGAPIRYDAHPDSGVTFAGVKMPWWEEGRALALEAHRRLAPEAIALGWDIALAEGAPVLLEVNIWTACYDYDPPSDSFTAACELIICGLAALDGAAAA